MSEMEKKSPYPFEKMAVAIAFSPRIEALLAESKRLQETFGSSICFIHIGKKDSEEEKYLEELLHRYELNKPWNKVIWEKGDPVEKILEICKDQNVDLLVAGALEKENLLKYFMGSVGRMLCRKAKCSILMLREPSVEMRPVRNIVVEGSDHPKTVNTIETGIYIAKKCGAHEISVIQEEDVSKMALIRSNEFSNNEAEEHKEKVLREEDDKLNEILSCTDCGDVHLNTIRLEGKPGFVISKYAKDHQADLLMLNSPDTKLGLFDRVFPHDIEFALADLPCDLLIVHSREKE